VNLLDGSRSGDNALSLDNLLGSSDLIGIRGRATFSRPFTRVEALRRGAEDKFRVTEERLKQQLREAEQKLAQLQARREDRNAMSLSPEQEKEIENFRNQRVEIRKELRQVQRNLDQDIERRMEQLRNNPTELESATRAVVEAIRTGRRRRQELFRLRQPDRDVCDHVERQPPRVGGLDAVVDRVADVADLSADEGDRLRGLRLVDDDAGDVDALGMELGDLKALIPPEVLEELKKSGILDELDGAKKPEGEGG
jgi:hypothetical protein